MNISTTDMMFPYCPSIHDTVGNYVVIGNTSIDIDHQNDAFSKALPTTVSKRGTTTPETRTIIINTVAIKKSYTVKGELLQGQMEYASGLNETKTNAKDKLNLLIDMIESGRTLTLKFDGTDHNGIITKDNLKIPSNDILATPNDGDAVFPVQFTFLVGVDRMVTAG